MSSRRAAAWLLSIPLMVAGSQVAHVFAYRLVYPDARVRLRELLASGHGYMAFAPRLMGIGIALELVAFASITAGLVRRRRHATVQPWAFALLPPAGFALQEFFERWLAGAPFPWWMVLQPTFRVGLLLQLPFALLAYLTARLLLRLAESAAGVFRSGPAPARRGVPRGWALLERRLPRLSALREGHAGRGPPFGLAGSYAGF